jgi:hypothetical protein
MSNSLVLYGTAGCHLCDEASMLLTQAGLVWDTVDIADDDILLARYGTRIPVLLRMEDGSEISWPFQQTDLERFIVNPQH